MEWVYERVMEDLSNSGAVSFTYIILTTLISSIFYILKWLLSVGRECNKRFKKKKVTFKEKKGIFSELFASYFLEFFISCGISYIFVIILGFNGVFIGPTLGILIGYFLEDKVISKNDIVKKRLSDIVDEKEEKNDKENEDDSEDIREKKEETEVEDNSDDKDENNQIHIDADHEVMFYNPSIRLKKGMTIDRLSICDILEIYGYVSQNQIYKMISSSIFETPDEQINKLLDMTALEPDELKEAKTIFNLIRLKKRLVTRDEALNYLIEVEKKEANKSVSESKKGV